MSWGILMGAGKGLQDAGDSYGRIMDQKRQQDYTLERDAIQFERQKSLENLRNKNEVAREDTRWDREKEKFGMTMKANKEQRMDERRYQEGRYETERKDKVEDEEKLIKARADAQAVAAQEQMETAYEFTKTAKEEERLQKHDELKNVYLTTGDKKIDFNEQLQLAAVKTGIDVRHLVPGEKSKISAEMYSKVSDTMMLNDEYAKLAEKDPMAYIDIVERKIRYMQDRQPQSPEGEGTDPVEVLTGLLDSGKETPESMMAQAQESGNPAEIEAATAAINIYEKKNPGAPEEPEETDAERVKRMTVENQKPRSENVPTAMSALKSTWNTLRTPNELPNTSARSGGF